MSETFSKVVSSVGGLSYSAITVEWRALNFIEDPSGHQRPSVLASGRKQGES